MPSDAAAVTEGVYRLKAELFKTLGHPARIRVLQLLRDGDRTVGELVAGVGLEPSHLSQQLAVLRRAGIVEARRHGSNVSYSVRDPRIFDLLTVAKDILTASLSGARDLLGELDGVDFSAPGPES